MNGDPLPYLTQMRNGGSVLAHLLSSMLTPFDASRWLQPPQHALDIGAATSTPPTDPLLAAFQCAYQDWKWAVNKLWEHEHHRLQMAARQCEDNEGSRAESANDEEGREERADNEQRRAECELALACLQYEQEWPLLDKAKER
jgi:hypothetical protein